MLVEKTHKGKMQVGILIDYNSPNMTEDYLAQQFCETHCFVITLRFE